MSVAPARTSHQRMVTTPRRLRRASALAMALPAVLLLIATVGAASAQAGAMQRLRGCTTNSLPANDDGSSAKVSLPFSVNFGGTPFNSLYVNNNGNVTFDGSLSAFTPAGLAATGHLIIAPFWADADTRATGSALTKYGTTTFEGHQTFCAEWDGVGYYQSHGDKLNKFELLLVSHPERAAGDFDIIFNYDQVKWETGDASMGSGGLGGVSAHVGYSVGPNSASEFSGSGTNGAFLDGGPRALATGSTNGGTPGRYVFAVSGGNAQGGGQGLHGLVTSHNAALVGAQVEACPSPSSSPAAGSPCRTASTNGQGTYEFVGLATGLWNVTVNPPSGDQIDTQTRVGPVQINGSAPVVRDVVMSTLTPPPTGTVVGGTGTFGGGQPIVNWRTATPLRTQACVGATSASFEIIDPAATPNGTPSVVQQGPLSEGPAGTYSGTIPPLEPFNGFAQIKITVNCATGPPEIGSFDIYVDPSGVVVDTDGNPIPGATVTLSRSDSADGPFAIVPDGSAIMAPNNRSNPSTTDSVGHFGWDVVSGFYTVTATKAGCTSVKTAVLPVPPPVTDLRLVIDCRHPSIPPPTPGPVTPLHLSLGKLKVTSSGAVASLTCRGPIGTFCVGTARMTTRERLVGKKVVGVAARRKTRRAVRTVVVGRVAYKIAAGRTATIRASLNATGRRLLKAFRRLPARLTITLRGSNGKPTTVVRRTVVLKTKGKGKKRMRR